MTYGLGMWTESGLVMASDSRSNAGIDQISAVDKVYLYSEPEDRAMILLAAGNLATTQAVAESLRQSLGKVDGGDLFAAATMFDAARIVGDTLRTVISRDGSFVQAYGDPSASFLFGGQIAGTSHRLFLIYAAGNFIEASRRTPFLQIGETKYGKPILDRAFTCEHSLSEATKLALISFDATIRSNLSVAPPVDLIQYRADSLKVDEVHEFGPRDPYFTELSSRYSSGLNALLSDLPALPDD